VQNAPSLFLSVRIGFRFRPPGKPWRIGSLLVRVHGGFTPSRPTLSRPKAFRGAPAFELKITERNSIKEFENLGPMEYLRLHNVSEFEKIVRRSYQLDRDLQANEADSSISAVIEKTMLELNKWKSAFANWFVENGYPVPRFESSLKEPSESSELEQLKNEHRVTIDKLILYRRKDKSHRLNEEELLALVNSVRRKNGKINYSKAAKLLGVHHTTAKSWIEKRGMK
jgi:hypothetical protein